MSPGCSPLFLLPFPLIRAMNDECGMMNAENGSAGTSVPPPAPPVAVQKCYDLVLYLLQRAEKFPRAHKFTVGDRLAEAAMDVLENLVAAAYSRDKTALLERANLRLHRVRFLVRLAKDLRALPLGSYEHASERIDEVGRLIGGWRRSRGGGGQ